MSQQTASLSDLQSLVRRLAEIKLKKASVAKTRKKFKALLKKHRKLEIFALEQLELFYQREEQEKKNRTLLLNYKRLENFLEVALGELIAKKVDAFLKEEANLKKLIQKIIDKILQEEDAKCTVYIPQNYGLNLDNLDLKRYKDRVVLAKNSQNYELEIVTNKGIIYGINTQTLRKKIEEKMLRKVLPTLNLDLAGIVRNLTAKVSKGSSENSEDKMGMKNLNGLENDLEDSTTETTEKEKEVIGNDSDGNSKISEN